jgi:hypothetical protein
VRSDSLAGNLRLRHKRTSLASACGRLCLQKWIPSLACPWSPRPRPKSLLDERPPDILFTVHEGAPFVGHDADHHNLLLKGRPFIMRFRQRISVTYRLVDLVARLKCWLNTLQLLLDHSDVKRNELCGPCPNALGADHQFERSLKTCTSGPELFAGGTHMNLIGISPILQRL